MVLAESGYVSCQACDSNFYVKYALWEWPPYCPAHRWPTYPKVSADEVLDTVEFFKRVSRINFVTLYGKSIA